MNNERVVALQCSSSSSVQRYHGKKNTEQLPVKKMTLKCLGCFDLLESQKISFHHLALLVYTISESDCVMDADEDTMGGFRSTSDVVVTSSSTFWHWVN